MEPEIAKLQLGKPISRAVSKGKTIRSVPPYPASARFPRLFLFGRKLFTILPTLIVNNNNNKRRRSSCEAPQSFCTIPKKKKENENQGRKKQRWENPEKRKVGKHFTLMTVQVSCSRRCRHGCHSNGSLNFTLTVGIVATF